MPAHGPSMYSAARPHRPVSRAQTPARDATIHPMKESAPSRNAHREASRKNLAKRSSVASSSVKISVTACLIRRLSNDAPVSLLRGSQRKTIAAAV